MRKFFLFVIVFLQLHADAQIKVQVVDSATGKELPFASVFCNEENWSGMANEQGTVEIPARLTGKSAKASYVSYRTSDFKIGAIKSIQLVSFPLPEVVINSCKNPVEKHIGWKRKQRFGFGWDTEQEGHLWGTWLPNKEGKPGKIHSISFYVTGHGNKNTIYAPIRLRFYKTTDTSFSQVEELVRDDIQVEAGRFGKIELDLSGYRIPFEPTGIIIAFEYLNYGEAYRFEVVVDGKKVKRLQPGIGIAGMPAGESFVVHGATWIANKFSRGGRTWDFCPAVGLDIEFCQ
jgi:hypothetical protein